MSKSQIAGTGELKNIKLEFEESYPVGDYLLINSYKQAIWLKNISINPTTKQLNCLLEYNTSPDVTKSIKHEITFDRDHNIMEARHTGRPSICRKKIPTKSEIEYSLFTKNAPLIEDVEDKQTQSDLKQKYGHFIPHLSKTSAHDTCADWLQTPENVVSKTLRTLISQEYRTTDLWTAWVQSQQDLNTNTTQNLESESASHIIDIASGSNTNEEVSLASPTRKGIIENTFSAISGFYDRWTMPRISYKAGEVELRATPTELVSESEGSCDSQSEQAEEEDYITVAGDYKLFDPSKYLS